MIRPPLLPISDKPDKPKPKALGIYTIGSTVDIRHCLEYVGFGIAGGMCKRPAILRFPANSSVNVLSWFLNGRTNEWQPKIGWDGRYLYPKANVVYTKVHDDIPPTEPEIIEGSGITVITHGGAGGFLKEFQKFKYLILAVLIAIIVLKFKPSK